MVCLFKHLYCSAQLSMSNMEKRYRNKIIIIIINSNNNNNNKEKKERKKKTCVQTIANCCLQSRAQC